LYDGVNQLLHFFTRDSGNPQWRSVDVVEQVIRTAAATSNGTVPIDSAGTRYQRITMGNFSFTVGNPSHAVVGRRLTIDIHNTASGTPTGTVTFSTDDPNGYKLTGGATTVSQPAASQHILITFDFDGSVWREVGRSADQT
jgi:hypothetical protein